MLNVNVKGKEKNNIKKFNDLELSNLRSEEYVLQNYADFVTLPPQIPVPSNQRFLYCFSITFTKINYLDVLSRSGEPGFLLKSFWWGQNNGYIHRLVQNVQSQSQRQTEYQNQKVKKKLQSLYKPVKFLVCCPLQNFFSYIFDMKILKLQLLQPQLKKIIAKTYINFTLLKGWEGEKLTTTLDVNLTNGKRAGQIIADLQIFKIQNPYNNNTKQQKHQMTPLNKTQKENENFNQSGLSSGQNHKENYIDEIQSKNKSSLKKQSKKNTFVRQRERKQRYVNQQEVSVYENDEGLQDEQIIHNQSQIEREHKRKQLQNRRRQQSSKNKHENEGFQRLQPKQTKSNYNFQTELIKLHQDFQLLFRNKSINFQQGQGNTQKIQFHLRLQDKDSNQQKQQNMVNINNKFNVVFPVLRKLNSFYKSEEVQYNQYNFSNQAIMKIQINPSIHTGKQLQNYLRNSVVQINLAQEHIINSNGLLVNANVKDKKVITNNVNLNVKQFSNKIPLYKLLSSQGSQIPVILQTDKKSSDLRTNQVLCIIKVKGQQQKQQVQQNTSINKKLSQTLPMNQFVWLKLMEFIPLKLSYFNNSNLFIRIVPQTKVKPVEKGIDINENSSFIESKTLWNAFADFSKSQTKLVPRAKFNQMLTFPTIAKPSEQNKISMQIWDKQKKTILVGYGIIDMNQSTNRREIEIYDTKQTVGYLTIWIQKGGIAHINNLISAHTQSQPQPHIKNSSRISQKQSINQSNQINNNNNDNDNDKSQQLQNSREQVSNDYSNYSQEGGNNSNQYHNLTEEQNIKKQVQNMNVNVNKRNRDKSGLEIHNIIYFKLLILTENNHENQVKFEHLQDELSLTQFTQTIKSIFHLSSQRGLNNTARLLFSDSTNDQIQLWIEKMCSCYGFVDLNSKYMINWRQFYDGYQAYLVYYDNIIQQRDMLLRIIIQELENNEISINQLQSKFVLVSKNKLYQKLSEIFSLELGQKIIFIYPNLKKIQELCDQLRKFQVYETTNQKYVDTQVLRQHIISEIRQILNLETYEKDKEILKIIKKEEIQLSKWQEMNLSELQNVTNRQKLYAQNEEEMQMQQKKNSNNKNQLIINKSPTFGFLQPYSHNLQQNLINTYPNNPSIIKNLPKKQNQLNLISSNENLNDSDTFRKRIQTISPINHVNSSANEEGKGQKMKVVFSNIDGLIEWIQIDNHTFYPDIGNRNINIIANQSQSQIQNNQDSLLHVQNEEISIFNIKKQFQYEITICLKVKNNSQENVSTSKQMSELYNQQQIVQIQCVHGQWQGIIDQQGNYRGCLKIC